METKQKQIKGKYLILGCVIGLISALPLAVLFEIPAFVGVIAPVLGFSLGLLLEGIFNKNSPEATGAEKQKYRKIGIILAGIGLLFFVVFIFLSLST